MWPDFHLLLALGSWKMTLNLEERPQCRVPRESGRLLFFTQAKKSWGGECCRGFGVVDNPRPTGITAARFPGLALPAVSMNLGNVTTKCMPPFQPSGRLASVPRDDWRPVGTLSDLILWFSVSVCNSPVPLHSRVSRIHTGTCMKAFSLWKGPVSSEALRKGARLSTVKSSVDIFACCPVLCFIFALFNGKDYFSTLSWILLFPNKIYDIAPPADEMPTSQ